MKNKNVWYMNEKMLNLELNLLYIASILVQLVLVVIISLTRLIKQNGFHTHYSAACPVEQHLIQHTVHLHFIYYLFYCALTT